MINRIKEIGWQLFIIALLVSCHNSYPDIYYFDETKENANNEVSDNYVPIIVMLNDPQYSVITKSLGPYESANSTQWENATFYVYAFLTNNSVYHNGADMTHHYNNTTDNSQNGTPYCIVDGGSNSYQDKGQAAKLIFSNGSVGLEWVNNNILYYNMYHQDYRYNFFAYYYDDAQINNFSRSRDSICCDVTINGSQDVMTGYAYPEKSDLTALESKYPNVAYSWDDLCYSSMTGHRGLYPRLHMNHHTSMFKFQIQGADQYSNDIRIDSIMMESPITGRMVMAHEDVTRLGVNWNESVRKNLYLPKSIGANGQVIIEALNASIAYKSSCSVGTSLLLAPASSYRLTLFCRQNVYDSKHQILLESNKPYHIQYNLLRRIEGGYGAFEEGTSYTIVVNVYGLQPITVNCDIAGWTAVQEPIIVDEDDLFGS